MLTRRELLSLSASRKPSVGGYWLHLSRPAMACLFEATLPISDEAGAALARDALAEAGSLEDQLTIFKETSEVSRINREASYGHITVEPSLFDLLVLCEELFRDTAGAFDITSAPLSK